MANKRQYIDFVGTVSCTGEGCEGVSFSARVTRDVAAKIQHFRHLMVEEGLSKVYVWDPFYIYDQLFKPDSDDVLAGTCPASMAEEEDPRPEGDGLDFDTMYLVIDTHGFGWEAKDDAGNVYTSDWCEFTQLKELL